MPPRQYSNKEAWTCSEAGFDEPGLLRRNSELPIVQSTFRRWRVDKARLPLCADVGAVLMHRCHRSGHSACERVTTPSPAHATSRHCYCRLLIRWRCRLRCQRITSMQSCAPSPFSTVTREHYAGKKKLYKATAVDTAGRIYDDFSSRFNDS